MFFRQTTKNITKRKSLQFSFIMYEKLCPSKKRKWKEKPHIDQNETNQDSSHQLFWLALRTDWGSTKAKGFGMIMGDDSCLG